MALGHHPSEEALSVLEEFAQSGDWQYRRAAAEAIGMHGLGRNSGNLLITLLRDKSPYVVRSACEAVSRLQMHEAHDFILHLVQSKDPATRGAAIQALSTFWKSSDSIALLDIFQADPTTEARYSAAWALRANADQENWKALFRVWKSDRLHRHRIWACELVGEYGDASFQRELEPLLEDPDGHVRKAAHRALDLIIV
jgi:HEAT repeat protein